MLEVFGHVFGIKPSLLTRVGDDYNGAAKRIDVADSAERSVVDVAVAVVAASDHAVSDAELLVTDRDPGGGDLSVINEQLPCPIVEDRSRVVVARDHDGGGQPGLLLCLVPVGEERFDRVGLSLVDLEFRSLA